MKNAAVTAPVAIVSAGKHAFIVFTACWSHIDAIYYYLVIITAILGFFVNVSLCYGIRDLTVLPGPTGLAVSQVVSFYPLKG